MHMGGTESEAVVKESGVNNGSTLCSVQQITQVTQVSVTTPHSVPGTVLVQDKHLARAEPSLHSTAQHRKNISQTLKWTKFRTETVGEVRGQIQVTAFIYIYVCASSLWEKYIKLSLMKFCVLILMLHSLLRSSGYKIIIFEEHECTK